MQVSKLMKEDWPIVLAIYGKNFSLNNFQLATFKDWLIVLANLAMVKIQLKTACSVVYVIIVMTVAYPSDGTIQW